MKKVVLFCMVFLYAAAYAQQGPNAEVFNKGIIKGVIVDSSDGNPLQYANIVLYQKSDSSYVGGISSGNTGEFIMSNITEGKYYLKISYMGYENRYVSNINVTPNTAVFDAGKISLHRNALEMEETKVYGEKVSEELHLDKKVINVSQDLNAAGNTALEVLQNQPSVRVDPDGTVYLRGSSAFTILINGKPSVLQGSDALRQIPANMIENIELITNPSSKYDAEGTSGIININLKKQQESSFSGILNLNGGTRDKYNLDGSVSYNYDGLNLTGGFDYRDNTNFNNQEIDRLSSSTAGPITNLTELAIRDKRRQYSGRAGMDYTFDDLNSLSLNVSLGKIDLDRNITTEVSHLTPSSSTNAENVNEMEAPITFLNSSLNYIHKFNPGVNDLNFEITYSNVGLPNVQETNEYITDAGFNTRQPMPKNTVFSNNSDRNEGRIKLNYTHKIGEGSTFEAGLQTNYSFRSFELENKKYDYALPGYIIDAGLTNSFDFRNNVYAAFVSYTGVLYDFNFMLGLRGEYMDRLLEQKTMGGDYRYEKMDYFPSVNISRKIADHQIQFSYSRRINRPNENLLNPFPFYTDSYLTSSGNPYLMPEYINSFELNYQKMFGSVFFSAQTYYRNSYDAIQQFFEVDNSGKMFTKFGNLAETSTYGSEVSSSFSLGQMFRFDPAVNLSGNEFEGGAAGQKISKNFFNWNARLNTTVTITPDTRLMVGANYFAKFVDAQGESKPFMFLTASIRQDLFDKRFSVTLQARNILRTSDFEILNKGLNYSTNIHVRQEVPVVSLMLSYNFNNFKRTNRPADNIDVGTGL